MVRAAARRSLAAFRISIALGSSTGSTVGAAAFFDDLAGLAACGAGGDCWAYPLVVRHTPSVSSSAHLRNLSRIIIPPDEHTLPPPSMGEGRKTTVQVLNPLGPEAPRGPGRFDRRQRCGTTKRLPDRWSLLLCMSMLLCGR